MTGDRFALASAGRVASARVVVALTATVAVAGGAWVVAVRRMAGMDMGVATQLGSFPSFVALWLSMMTAMMLPGAAPAVARWARDGRAAVPLFVASYLAVWMVVGLVAYVLYRPHGTLVAGAAVLAAGGYELTPVKRRFRRRGQERLESGLGFGLCCVGSSAGLMLMLIVLGPMSVTWMTVVTVLVVTQKLLAPNARIDVPAALAIAGLGALIVLIPSSVPGLTS